MQHQRGFLPQVGEEGGCLVKEQRQAVLDAGGGDALTHIFVNAGPRRVPVHALAPAGAKGRARRLVHGELTPRQQAHLRHRVQAALGVGVEGADGVHFVAEQVHPVGHERPHRKQVDQAASHRVLTRRNHLGHVLVAGQRQLRLQARFVQPRLLLEVEGGPGQKGGRGQARQGRRGRQQHHVQLALQHFPQRGQALGDQVLMGAEGVPRQGFPVRKHGHPQAGSEEGQFIGQTLRIAGVGGDHRQQALFGGTGLGQAGDEQGVA